MAAGDDNDVTIHGSFDGSLSRDLSEIVQRLERVEGQLDDAGRAGEQAGDRIERGADDAAEALARVERGAEGATDDLREVAKAADKAGDELGDVATGGRQAAAGLEAAEQGAQGATEALDDTARQAKQTARALDDAGDEAAEAGAKAATSATGWNRLAAALDRNERISQRWARAQDAMRWSAWTARAEKFKTRAKSLLDLDWGKGATRLNKFGKAFKGFTLLLAVGKITAIVGALYALLGVISALGAGAAGAVGGIGSMVAGLLALLPVGAAAVATMIAFKAAAKPLKDELDSIKGKFSGVGNAIANEGGLRAALDYLDSKIGKLAENVTSGMAIIGRGISKSTRDVADYASNYGFLQDLGDMWVKLGPIVEQFGKIITRVLHSLVNLIRMASPAALQLAKDVGDVLDRFTRWTGVMADNGKGAEYISAAYERLKRAVKIVADFVVGLYRVFKIAAEESRWMADGLERAGARFKEWTGTAEGQNKIRTYFQEAMPALKETLLLIKDLVVGLAGLATSQDVAPLINQLRTQLLPAVLELAAKFQGDLLPKLIDFLTRLAQLAAGLDFSALQIVLDFLIGVADALLWVAQNVPGGNAALSMLFTTLLLAGPVAKVLGFVTGAIGKLVAAGKWLSVALKGGEGLTFMQKVIGWIGKGVMWLARLFTGPLFKGISMVGRLLAVAFLGSNPIGWIILAVIAVVAAFWWCYENIQGFRDGVNGVLSAIGGFFSDLWNGYIWPVISAIVTGLKWVGAIIFTILVAPFIIAWNIIAWAVQQFIDNFWKPAIATLKEEWSIWYNAVFKPIGDAIAFVWNWLGTKLSEFAAWFAEGVAAAGRSWDAFYAVNIAPIANWIAEKWAWLGLQIDYFKWLFWGAVDALGQKWNEFYARWIQPVVNLIKGAWDSLNVKLGELAGWFQGKVDMIGRIWDTLRGKLAAPVNFLINTVWNQGILKAWNWVAEKLGLPQGQPISPIPAYAAGGAVRGPGTGRSDSIVARVANNEHIWTAEETRRAGGHAQVAALRRAALAGALPRFADGGPVSLAGDQAAPSGGALGSLVAWAWGWAKPILQGLVDPIINSIPFRGPPEFMNIPRGMATTGRDKLFEWAEKKLNEWGATSGAGGPLGGGIVAGAVGAMMAVLRGAFPGLALISGFRPGAITATGNKSYHGMGRAVDVPPRMDVFNWIRANFGARTRELIFSPAGGAQIHNGRPHMYTGVTRANHWDHVHWAFDNGGFLEPGMTSVYNGTGKPEPVFTAGQWDMLDPSNLVAAMQSTTPTLEARAASSREDELVGAVRALSSVLAERPPALAVTGDETRRAVLSALAQRDREQQQRDRYRY